MFSYVQVQKPEIRSGILSSAKELFFVRGFDGTTMRDISEAMQMSVSNVYKYFKNKQDLFEALVGEYAITFFNGMKQELSHSESEELDSDRIEKMVSGICQAIRSNHMVFFILMERSNGSFYQTYKKKCASLLVQHTLESLSKKQALSTRPIVQILIFNLFSAFSELALRFGDSNKLKPNMITLFQYHMTGFRALASK